MKLRDFEDLYLAELEELRSVESQIADHLGALAGRASHAGLAQAIREHGDATGAHRDRLDELIRTHDNRPDGHDDASMHAIISETEKWVGMIEQDDLRDAALIASLQRMEHYEMSVLGTLAAWARTLGHDGDATVLSSILEEDRGADARFSAIAEEVVNPDAFRTGPAA